MADDLLTIADLVGDALDLSGAEVSNLLQDAPFFAQLPAVESSNGETHKYIKETGAPVVGFRAANDGREHDSSIDTAVTVTLKILDFSWKVDKAVADLWRQGGAQALIAREGARHLAAALFKAEQQYIDGTGADSNGFTGFAQSTELDGLADDMVIDAGGTTSSTGSSVYLIRQGDPDVVGVIKGDLSLGETVTQEVAGSATGSYPAYYTPACAHVGIQIGGKYSVGRIANLTADSGKGLTDDLVYEALAEFPAGRQPNRILMNRRSMRQLRESRTATTTTGAAAPRPAEVDGIPIIVTDGITSTETLLT